MDSPESRSVQPPALGKVAQFPEVGGLHHYYERLAAWSPNVAGVRAVRDVSRAVVLNSGNGFQKDTALYCYFAMSRRRNAEHEQLLE